MVSYFPSFFLPPLFKIYLPDIFNMFQVYMPRGHREHTIYDDFDIAAVLNLMGQCNHFRKFIKHPLPINQVIEKHSNKNTGQLCFQSA